MAQVWDILFTRAWWQYQPGQDWYAQPYHWLNLIEGCAWLAFGVLVLVRYLRHRHSVLELWYCLAFVTFGLSDFREAYVLQTWLILFKGVNLVALVYLRWIILRRYYPASRTF